MNLSSLFEILPILNGKMRKDLKVFIKMSSNHLSKKEEKVINYLLLESEKNKILSEENFKLKYLSKEDLKNWNRMKNRFLEVLRKYLMLEIANTKAESNLQLALFFANKTLSKNFSSTIKRLAKQLNQNHSLDEKINYYKFQLYEIEEEDQMNIRKRLDDLMKMNNTLDEYYIENKLRIACEYLNRRTVINEPFSMNDFLIYIEHKNIEKSSIGVQMYYNIFKMLQTEKQIYFDTIFDLIHEYENSFTKKYLKSIFSYMLNHCSKMINKGILSFSTLYIDIIDLQINNDLLLENNIISSNRFKNCITISIIAKRINWTIDFLEQFKTHLPDNQINIYNFSLAQIFFFQEKYKECHEQLIGFKTNEMYNKIAYEKLLIKLYYYLYKKNKFNKENLRAKISGLKKYTNLQSKLKDERKNRVLAFLQCVSKLINNEELAVQKLLGKIPPIDFIWLKKEATQ